MKKLILGLFMLILLSNLVYANYNKIIQFDENEDIIITTAVYNSSGNKCIDCSCNITIYNPYPNENFINISINMVNNANGIYSVNVTNYTTLPFSKEIYPFTLVCNDSNGFLGGDNREGIKVSETVFDYTAGIIAVIGVAIGLLVMSFKIDPKFKDIKRICFFSSFAFMFSALALGYTILAKSPQSSGILTIFIITITALLMVFMAVLFFYVKELTKDSINIFNKRRV